MPAGHGSVSVRLASQIDAGYPLTWDAIRSAVGNHPAFPWTVSDFSLMDAIECGIVKLPRVPVAENIPGNEMPMFRNL